MTYQLVVQILACIERKLVCPTTKKEPITPEADIQTECIIV